MICIKDCKELTKLMEHRYEPIIATLLMSVAEYGQMQIINANPGRTCLPVREIILSTIPYNSSQISRMCSTINTYWQYDNLNSKKCIELESDFQGQRIVVRVCNETRRRC